MNAWPNDALALLSAVIEFEDEHPKMSACLGEALDRVPAEIRADALGRTKTIREVIAWFEAKGEDVDDNIADHIRQHFLGEKKARS